MADIYKTLTIFQPIDSAPASPLCICSWLGDSSLTHFPGNLTNLLAHFICSGRYVCLPSCSDRFPYDLTRVRPITNVYLIWNRFDTIKDECRWGIFLNNQDGCCWNGTVCWIYYCDCIKQTGPYKEEWTTALAMPSYWLPIFLFPSRIDSRQRWRWRRSTWRSTRRPSYPRPPLPWPPPPPPPSPPLAPLWAPIPQRSPPPHLPPPLRHRPSSQALTVPPYQSRPCWPPGRSPTAGATRRSCWRRSRRAAVADGPSTRDCQVGVSSHTLSLCSRVLLKGHNIEQVPAEVSKVLKGLNWRP